jgi:epoxyqueuosine reductase
MDDETEDGTRRLDLVSPGGADAGVPGDRSTGPGDAADPTRSAAGDHDAADRLKARARELGFDQVGIAPAETPDHADWFRTWVEEGWHGEMGWMAREDTVRRRLSLEDALPGCRSVVMVSMSYAGEAPTAPGAAGGESADAGLPAGDRPPAGTGDRPAATAGDPLAPVVARYARGRDYHGVFEEKLEALAETVRELDPDARVKPYVDYGPVLERGHAQRAGLGWIGKNTCLIDPEAGSWLLLGELLTTLELPPDEPFTADRCGSCTRCIEACPTDAIRGPRKLDARRCISYLTIELEGSIPEDLRPKIGNRIFGCDICQEVCPWNRDAPAHDHPELEPGRPVAFDSMVDWAEELLELDEAGFRERYGDTALERPGRNAMLRNLCVGLGNSDRPKAAAPVLERCARDGSELVREHARWAMEELDGP